MEKKKGMKKKVPNVKAAKQAHEAVDNEHAPNEHASDVAKKKVAKNMSDKLISKVEDKFGVKL
ncbi:MAG: hypothetical protein GWN01_10015, partial [Nitrosopumilaceae archaeon]|nr:hypothetical protein [Nitrosopumilaceae archaeon]NIU87596.1 hypothetical protein [Nitrosopumilaceae archaeon]NIX61842.1 hypothetical protein [Nitrosopumilaceae archaeon]